MQKALKNLISSNNAKLIPAILNIISIMLSLRGIVKSKNPFWGIIHLVNAGISGYLLFKNTKELLAERK